MKYKNKKVFPIDYPNCKPPTSYASLLGNYNQSQGCHKSFQPHKTNLPKIEKKYFLPKCISLDMTYKWLTYKCQAIKRRTAENNYIGQQFILVYICIEEVT